MQAFYKSFHENFTLHYSKIEPHLKAKNLKKEGGHIKMPFKLIYKFNKKKRCGYLFFKESKKGL